MGRISPSFKGILQVVYLVVICLVLGETSVRVLYGRLSNYNMEVWRYAAELKLPLDNPRLPFHHRPNEGGEYYGVDISTNSMGFRDIERSPGKPEGTRRILFLGDSFTLGWGVRSDSVFSHQVETMLNQGGGGHEVINMGVGNYNTVMEVELFKLKGLRLDPDIVVLVYFLNDTEPVPERRSGFTYSLIKHSYFISFLFDRLTRLRSRLQEGFQWQGYYRDLYSDAASGDLAANREAFCELVTLCKNRGIGILVVNVPELRELNRYPFDYATDYIRNLALEADVPFVDLLPGLRGYDPQSLWVSPEDPHANAKANTVIAEQIYLGLVEKVGSR